MALLFLSDPRGGTNRLDYNLSLLAVKFPSWPSPNGLETSHIEAQAKERALTSGARLVTHEAKAADVARILVPALRRPAKLQ